MMCVGDYEIKSSIYETRMKKINSLHTNETLDDSFMSFNTYPIYTL